MKYENIIAFNAPYNEQNMRELIEQIKNNSVVPYIGAGMSVLSDGIYPSWSQFLNDTFIKYVYSSEREKFQRLECEKQATFLYDKMGQLTFAGRLKEVFGDEPLQKGNSLYTDKPAFLIPLIFDKGPLITTNYDKVIEKSYSLYSKILSVAHPCHFEALNGALRNNELLLYKIHGDIIEPIESIILTEEQYDSAYSNTDLTESLKTIYCSRDILFLGCSISKDRPIQLLRSVSQSGMKNFAIVSCKQDEIQEQRLELENKYFTKAIMYPEGQHECLFELLKHIAEAVGSDCHEEVTGSKLERNKLDLSDEWFENQNSVQIKNLGDRYLPDLNVATEVNSVFDGLSRNDVAYNRFINESDKLLICLNEPELSEINDEVLYIINAIKHFKINSINKIEIKNIKDALDKIDENIGIKIQQSYDDLDKVQKGSSEYQSYDSKIYKLGNAQNAISNYEGYLSTKEVKAINAPFILLHGEGGIGKSHLLADVVSQRRYQGNKSLFFLGQHFKSGNPITEMLNSLELICTSNELFEFLNKKAEESESRIIIFIDALNEGNGKEIWYEYLAGIQETIKKYPWLGLVVSIRTEYVDKLFENHDALKDEFIFVKHSGFSSIEYEAIKKYFDHYDITNLDIPFGAYEFRNPLFVRLFCESFRNQHIDWAQIGVADVYRTFLNCMNDKVASECGYSSRINVVEEVIDTLVLYRHNQNSHNNIILLDNAIQIIIGIEKKYNIQTLLLDELISCGVLTQSCSYDNKEYIYITYEKLDDYRYGKLLSDDLNKIGIKEFRTKYLNLVQYGDILEAFAIVLSEDANYELFEVFEEHDSGRLVRAFCRALKWRNMQNINSVTINYINEVVINSRNGFSIFFEELILLSTKPNHALNADWTVNYILNYSMPDRDAIFIPLFNELFFDDDSAIQHLLDWSLFHANKDNLSNELIKLTAMMLATFLISSNNYLRDKTTKVLKETLNGKLDVLIFILEKYKSVDDPYIIERLYAVAFGCITSEQDNGQVEKLALHVYNAIFKKEKVYPNILLRDYAKSIINYAKYKVKSPKLLSLQYSPPYDTTFPIVPADSEIEKYEFNYKSPDFKDHYWGQNAILGSMRVEYNRDGSSAGYGDFGRYTFQSYFYDWKDLNPNDLSNIAVKKYLIWDMMLRNMESMTGILHIGITMDATVKGLGKSING